MPANPTARRCSWCGTVALDADATHCASCGGPLPPPPGADPGPPPPPAPRALPAGYPARVLVWRNVMVLVGVPFVVIGLFWAVLAVAIGQLVFAFPVVFSLVGLPLARAGWRRAATQLDALRRGVPARAEIVAVYQDTSQSINGRHPWAIDYVYEGPGGVRLSGTATGWDPVHGLRRAGEALWALYLPDDPTRSTLWPPVR